MKLFKESQTLKAEAKTGKTKYWKIKILKDKNNYYIQKEYWQEGSKHQSSEPVLIKGKNIGKSNETTSKTQALAEFDARILLQKKKYVELNENIKDKQDARPLPMLALKYKDKKNKITWPMAGQPKLDGVRGLQNTSIGFWTRASNFFIPEVVEHLKFDTNDYIFDGEIKLPHVILQQTRRAITKYRKELSTKLRYYIYDIVDETKTFRERYEIYKNYKFPSTVITVKTVNLKN